MVGLEPTLLSEQDFESVPCMFELVCYCSHMSARNQGKTRLPASFQANTSEHAKAGMNSKSVRKVSGADTARKSIGKADARYWLQAGKLFADSRYGGSLSCKIQVHGRRESFPLRTANKNAAASKASRIYGDVIALGWDAALVKHKPETAKAAKIGTVGALIECATRLSSARRESMTTYCQALRRLASGVLGLKDANKRHPLQAPQWRAKVDSVPLDKLTPAGVLAFKNSFLKTARAPEARNSAAVSFNALLRNSKALLSKKLRPFIEKEITLPQSLWFEGVSREKEPSLRYHSKIDAGQILAAAHAELAVEQPEVFKALLLTLACGLRRSEADALLWRQFDFDAGTLSIADTEHKALKSSDSAGVIGLDAELVAILRGFRARAKSEFVLEAALRRRAAPKRNYRADVHFEALLQWLRAKGVPGIRPIHTMRKEIGSIIASRDGIFAASRFLRHSDIGITSRLYADSKKPVCAGLGALLTARADNVVEAEFKAVEPASKSKRQARHRAL